MTEIIIGIPGVWKNRTELIQAVATQSDGYLLAGHVLHNKEKNITFPIEVYEYEPHLKEAFDYASKGAFPESLLTEIDHHTFTVYIIAEVSDFEAVINLIDAGSALLKAGGMAVKIETAGMAHTKEAWQTLQKNPDIIPVYAHFVTIIGEEDHYGSFGMKAFGLPDVVTPNTMSPKDAVTLLSTFNFYNLGERPTFTNGQDFRIKSDAPTFTLTSRQDFRYEEDHPFYNPYGLWSLEK
ncbi:endopeptidase [Peribacillus sp. NPDC097206]|uniref:endopeptidase n=1 Tax=unclassified Peribacillus TaxID=2675266 RepID=UPI00381C612B